eukprot:4954557-Ditylum_brightwellii.AAC.1
MHISHGSRDHLTLAAKSIWVIFETNKVMKTFQLQGLTDKLEAKIKELKNTIKTLAADVKAAKSQDSSTVTKADKALAKGG